MIVASFKLKRQISYFILQIYVPCILVVLLSWVGFYLDREDTLDRVSLGNQLILYLFCFLINIVPFFFSRDDCVNNGLINNGK